MTQNNYPSSQTQIQKDIQELINLVRQVVLILEKNERGISLNKLLNYEEAAELLGVQPGSLRGWVLQRRIPHIKLAHGKAVRFEPQALLEWIKSGSIPAQESQGA